MRVINVGVLIFDPVRGAYMQGWEMDPEGETFATDRGLQEAQLAAALAFIGAATGSIRPYEEVDPSTASMAQLAIQRASSRDH